MNKSVMKFIKTVKRGFGKRSPEILLGIGIASGITATVLAVKATPKALQLIEEAKFNKATAWNEEHSDSHVRAVAENLPQVKMEFVLLEPRGTPELLVKVLNLRRSHISLARLRRKPQPVLG